MKDESNIPTVLRRKLPPNLEKIKQGYYTSDDFDYPLYLYLKNHDITVDQNGSEIVDFLKGKRILITGATGFLGKLLVEKLLRSCNEIETIYLIIRTKKGKDVQTRVKEYLDNWVFIKLSEIYPNFKDKVVGISGDFEEPGIGLSEESRKLLADKVNIIYHVAATVRFDDKLKKSVTVNIKGTQEIIKLAKECKNLDVLTHVSSAFSNCHVKEIGEKFYEPVMDPYELMELTDKLSNETLDRITPGLLGNMPNTYAFTKQIAEDLVRREAIGIPTCIQRPSIVIATVREPIRSWVDNIFGPVGIVEGAAMGLLHVIWCDPKAAADMVPADYTINNCIAASYKTAKDRLTSKVQIFNFTTSTKNQLYWSDLKKCSIQGSKVGSTNILWKYFLVITKYYYWYLLLNFIFHTIPGHVLDFVAIMLGKKPQLRKAYKKITKFTSVLSYFTLNQWRFDRTQTEELWKSLNEKDKKNFKFDLDALDWKNYFDTYLVAMREFLLGEFLDNLEQGRVHCKRMTMIYYVCLSAILGLSIYFFINSTFWFIPGAVICLIFYISWIQS